MNRVEPGAVPANSRRADDYRPTLDDQISRLDLAEKPSGGSEMDSARADEI